MRRVFLGVLALASTAFAIDFPNMKSDVVEVIGVSPDGGAYALRVSSRFWPTGDGRKRASVCGYPPVPASKVVDAVDLVACVTGSGCGPRLNVYRLPRQPEPSFALDRSLCTAAEQAARNLEAAKSSLSDAGIALEPDAGHTLPFDRLHLSSTVPAGALQSFGLNGPVKLELGVRDERHRLVATCDGITTEVAPLPFVSSLGLQLGQVVEVPRANLVLVFLSAAMNAESFIRATPTGAFDQAPLELQHAYLAARLLNQRALNAHRAKKFADAARDFEAAFTAQPSFAQASFNLACARARLQQTEAALAALEAALSVDRATFAAKARADLDLAPLRELPRFKTLTAQ